MAYLLAQPSLDVRGAEQKLPAGQILIFGGDLAYPNATMEEYDNRCIDPYSWAFTADKSLEQPRRELFFVAGNHDWYDGLAAFSNQFCYETSAIGGWRCKQERSYFGACSFPIAGGLGHRCRTGRQPRCRAGTLFRGYLQGTGAPGRQDHHRRLDKTHYEALAHAFRIRASTERCVRLLWATYTITATTIGKRPRHAPDYVRRRRAHLLTPLTTA